MTKMKGPTVPVCLCVGTLVLVLVALWIVNLNINTPGAWAGIARHVHVLCLWVCFLRFLVSWVSVSVSQRCAARWMAQLHAVALACACFMLHVGVRAREVRVFFVFFFLFLKKSSVKCNVQCTMQPTTNNQQPI